MPIFSVSRDFVTKNGLITEGASEVTSSTGNTNAIQSAGGIAAAKNLIVGTTATIHGPLTVNSDATFQHVTVVSLTATSSSTLVDLYVNNIYSTGVVQGTITGNINTATNLGNGTLGQIPYQTAPGATAFTGPGNSGEILTSRGSAQPIYQNTLTLSGTTAAVSTNSGALQVRGGVGIGGDLYVGGSIVGTITSATNIVGGGSGQIPYQNSTGTTNFVTAGVAGTILVSNGTSAPTFNNTLTLAGTTEATSTNSGALQVVGGAGIGGALYVGGTIYAPAFNGTATTATNLAAGSTGAIPYQFGAGVTQFLNLGTAGQFLRVNSGANAPEWASTSTAVFGNTVNIVGGTTGSIAYQSAEGITGFIPIGTNGYVLTSNGTTATFQSLSSLSAGNALTATNVANGLSGQLLYQQSPGQTDFVSTGTVGDVLVTNGTGAPTFNNTLTLAGTTGATNTSSGALQVRGGVGIGENLYVGGNEVLTGSLTVNSTAANTATKSSNALYVQGGTYIDKTLVVEDAALFKGTVTFSGTATYAYSTNTVITDNLINLHVPPGSTGTTNHTWTLDDGYDIGLIYHYYKTTDKNAFLGLANDTGYLEWYNEGDESGGVFTGTSYGTFKLGAIKLVGGTANAANTNSGDLQVLGGVGINGGLFVNSTTTVNADILPNTNGTINLGSSTKRFGTLFVSSATLDVGGLIIGSDGTNLTVPSVKITATTTASSITSGALQVAGGAGVSDALYVGGLTRIQDSTQSTTTSSGALVVSGGVGIAKDVKIGGVTEFGTVQSNTTVVGFTSNNSQYATFTSDPITNGIQVILDTFSTSSFRTAKYTVQMVDGSNIHSQELLLFHDGTTVYKTEYGVIYNTSELGSFDADISGGNCRLLFTASPVPTSLVVKMVRTTITI